MDNVTSGYGVGDIEPDDELDKLFAQLDHHEPPIDMVERIMNAVADLALSAQKSALPWDNLEEPVVNHLSEQFS